MFASNCMKINNFFPTRVLSDVNVEFAEKLLPLCNKDNWVEHEVFQKSNDEPRKAFSFNI